MFLIVASTDFASLDLMTMGEFQQVKTKALEATDIQSSESKRSDQFPGEMLDDRSTTPSKVPPDINATSLPAHERD